MNWDAIGAVGEVVGAIAVVITLLYLAIQIRLNTKMARATIRQELAKADQVGLLEFTHHTKALRKAFSEEEPEWESPEEKLEAELILTAAFRSWENFAYQYREGLLEESEWNGMIKDIEYRSNFPYVKQQWHQTRERYSITLQNAFDPILGKD